MNKKEPKWSLETLNPAKDCPTMINPKLRKPRCFGTQSKRIALTVGAVVYFQACNLEVHFDEQGKLIRFLACKRVKDLLETGFQIGVRNFRVSY